MKALAATYSVADAAVQAIAAGCDGVLVCRAQVQDRSRDMDVQVEVLEALVHAVEDGRIPYPRLEDALARQRRMKERFLTAPVTVAPRQFAQVIGCDAHARIAEEMARYL
jgi:beta-N-acetylhexosaminidase